MSNLAAYYTYRVFFDQADGYFVATVAEWPSLSCAADSQVEALNGVVEVVKDALSLLTEDGGQPPCPLQERRYSGKMTLRVPPELHRRLAIEAAEQNVSINRLAATKLAA